MTLRDVLLTAINTQTELEATRVNGPILCVNQKGQWLKDGYDNDPFAHYLSVEDVVTDAWQIVTINRG